MFAEQYVSGSFSSIPKKPQMTKLDVGGTADRIGMRFFCSFNVPLNDWNVARVYKHGWGDLNDWNVARVLLLYIQRADLIIRDLGQCPRQGTGYKYCTYGTSTILYQVLLASNIHTTQYKK